MSHVDVAKRGGQTRQRNAPASGNADVLIRVLGFFSAAIHLVVIIRNLLTEIEISLNVGIAMAGGINCQVCDARRRIGDWARFRRALPEVGPRRMIVTESVFGSLAHHIDDSGLWHGPETGNGRFHKFSCIFSHGFYSRCLYSL